MTTKKDTSKKRFNRKHLFWLVPLVLIVAFIAFAAISNWRGYEDDRKNFSSVVESNQILTDTVYGLAASSTDVVVTGMRDFCTYDQGKLGREGPPECGREVTVRAVNANTRKDMTKVLIDKIRKLSEADNLVNNVPYKRHCGVHDNQAVEGGLVARCSQMMKVWDMYPDLPGRTYN